jgi:septum formation protein
VKQAARAGGATASETAALLATLKARSAHAADPAAAGALVVGADQLLTCGGAWFDKPATRAEARDHLQRLRGRTHTLHTAVACLCDGVEVWRHVATPRLAMRAFSDAVLDAYLDVEGDAVLSNVGAYRLEGPGLQLFERIDGEHGAILGLPMLPLLGFLRQHGILPD